jgi:hypothetical protein
VGWDCSYPGWFRSFVVLRYPPILNFGFAPGDMRFFAIRTMKALTPINGKGSVFRERG